MADVERVTRMKHAHESNALSYGHFGTATYDDQRHSWTFLRQTRPQAELHLDHEPDLALDHGSSVDLSHYAGVPGSGFSLVHEQIWPDRSKTPRPGQQVHARKNTFLKQIPDAAFAILSLHAAASPSASLPVNGNILAFGNARTTSEYGVRNNPLRSIVAFAAGPGGETLRLLSLDASDVLVSDSSGLEQIYRVPAIGHQAHGHWAISAEPILQVALAHQYRAQVLVVKSSGTSIIRPLLAGNALSATRPSDDSRDVSLIEPSLLVTIPASRTGGNPHVHSAFHPQDQNTVAVIDAHGVWSIWKLTGARARSARVLYSVQLICSSDLANATNASHVANGPAYYDGWHRICWLEGAKGSIDRILVCNRRSAAVFDHTGALIGSVDMRLGPRSEGNQILDVKNSDRRTDHILVLTTSRLLIFTSSKASWKDRSGREPLTLVCSWNHFRASNDLSLRMSLCEFPQATSVLVYSRTSHLTIAYQFGTDGTNQNTVSLRDPSIFKLPSQLQARMKHVCDIVLCPVQCVASGQPSTQTYRGFLKLVACLEDGTIVEAVYRHRMGKQWEAAEDGLENIFSLPLSGTTGHRVQQSARYVDEDDLEGFVVDDDVDEQRALGDVDSFSQSGTDSPQEPRFRNWERLLESEVLRDKINTSSPSGDVLLEAAQRIQVMSLENKVDHTHLLSDILGPYQITDVEQDSELLKSWLDELNNSESVSVGSTGLHRGLLPDFSQDNLLSLYDDLIASYIESLPSEVTDRNRVNRERLVRQAAADAYMSDVVLKIGRPELTNPPPAISEGPVSSSPPDSDREGASSSQVSASQSPSPQEEPAVARLRRYAEFHEVVPPLLLSLKPDISNVLAHLPDTLEEDPARYSYREVTQRLKLAQEEMATQSLDPRERRKAARHAARRQRKLERTAKISQEALMQRTVLPSIATGRTGMTLPGREVQSSQMAGPASSQTASQGQEGIPGLSMTQPERGAFGTRPAKTNARAKAKAKGKAGRTPGF